MHVNTMIFQMFPGKKHFQFWDGKRINTMVSKIFIMKSTKNRWPSHYPRVRFEVHPSPAQHEAGRWCSIVTSGSRDLALPAMGQMGVSENGFLSHPNDHFNQKRMIKRIIFSLSKFGAADFQINSNMPLHKKHRFSLASVRFGAQRWGNSLMWRGMGLVFEGIEKVWKGMKRYEKGMNVTDGKGMKRYERAIFRGPSSHFSR